MVSESEEIFFYIFTPLVRCFYVVKPIFARRMHSAYNNTQRAHAFIKYAIKFKLASANIIVNCLKSNYSKQT